MTWSKDRTTVLIGKYRRFKGVYFTSDFHNIALVGADEWSEYRKLGYYIGDAERLHRLACHLSHTFARYYRFAVFCFRREHGKAHHISSQYESEIIFIYRVAEHFLYMRQRDYMNVDFSRIAGEFFCKRENFFFRSFTCIREAFKMESLYFYSAFCHHKSRDGAVYSSGKEKKPFSV